MSLNLWGARDTQTIERAPPTGRVRSTHLFAKRAFDISVATLALIALLPLFMVLAIAVKLSGAGPVLFVQEREGLHGKPFSIFKFRTLRHAHRDLSGLAQTVEHDPRISRVGLFLRRSGLDELPQLFNVLRGEMALVGPRPHVPLMQAGGMDYRILVPDYDLRLSMRPGLTGWAQAKGLRGPTHDADMARQRIEHDLAYVQNFSFWFDLKIIALTVRHELFGGS